MSIVRILVGAVFSVTLAVPRGAPAAPGPAHATREDADMQPHDAVRAFHTLGNGRWFPASRVELERMVCGFVDAAVVPAPTGRLIGGLSPHAGFVYSGATAGHTFRAIRSAVSSAQPLPTLVLLGFSHRGAFTGTALLDADSIVSPLGAARIDRDASRFLARQSPLIRMDSAPHRGEHSAENQVPFAQLAAPESPLVIAIMGSHDARTVDATAKALGALAAQQPLLIVASTDLLHDPDYERVRATDAATLATITRMDEDGLRSTWSYDHQPCCGLGPVLVLLRHAHAQGARSGTLLNYTNSGDLQPESRGSWVVGYGSVVFCAP